MDNSNNNNCTANEGRKAEQDCVEDACQMLNETLEVLGRLFGDARQCYFVSPIWLPAAGKRFSLHPLSVGHCSLNHLILHHTPQAAPLCPLTTHFDLLVQAGAACARLVPVCALNSPSPRPLQHASDAPDTSITSSHAVSTTGTRRHEHSSDGGGSSTSNIANVALANNSTPCVARCGCYCSVCCCWQKPSTSRRCWQQQQQQTQTPQKQTQTPQHKATALFLVSSSMRATFWRETQRSCEPT